MGKDHVEWFLGAVGFPSLEEDDRVFVPAPKNGVNSRNIKLHALRHQRGRSRCGGFVGRESFDDFADVERKLWSGRGLGFQARIFYDLCFPLRKLPVYTLRLRNFQAAKFCLALMPRSGFMFTTRPGAGGRRPTFWMKGSRKSWP